MTKKIFISLPVTDLAASTRSTRHMNRAASAERWAQMAPEEREKFRKGMRGRCGHRAAPPAVSKA